MAPFPTIPVMTIALGQLSQYYFWTSPFAYAGFMVEHLDVVDDKDKVGYYAGMLASSFAFGRISSAFLWGIVGDRYGYLLVTYISMFAIAISSIAFGFSMTFVMAFTSRFIAGVCTGQTVAGKSLVSDVCGEEHELVGMGLIATSWSLGLSIGPGVGGFLAEPATFFPETFSRTGLFGRFPYLLPNLVGAGLAVITVPMTHFSLGRHEAVVRRSYRHELLKGDTDMESSRRDASKSDMSLQTPHRTPSRSRNQFFTPGRIFYPSPSMVRKGFDTPTKTPGGSVDFAAAGLNIPSPVPQSPSEDGTNQPRERAPSTEDDGRSVDYRCCAIRNVEMFSSESLLSKANVRTVVGAYALYSVVFAGFGEVFPLWALSSVERGGLDWSTKDLGEVFLPCGVSILIFEAIVIPFLTKRIGITTSQRLASLCSALSCLAIPFLSRLSSAGSLLYWATFVVLFSNNACLNAIFLNISVAINNCTDESRRGEVNGLATTSGALSEAIAPVLFAALFAASINHDNPVPFDFHLVFLLMGIIMVLVLAVGWSSIKTVYGEELVVEVHDGSHTDQAEPAAGTQSENSPENSGDFPISTADSAVCV